VKFDEQYTYITQKNWETLIKTLSSGDLVWDAIERTRADYYATLYQRIYTLIAQQSHGSSLCQIVHFDELGDITDSVNLPHPTTIT
jgi:hypothetical protein